MIKVFAARLNRIATVYSVTYALTGLLAAQASLRITSPPDGTLVNAGEPITVTVEASGGVFQQVYIIGQDPIQISQPLAAPPYRFTIQIPSHIRPDRYMLTAHGFTSPGQGAMSEPIDIRVERADPPLRLRAEPTALLDLQLGEGGNLEVIGEFADGTATDLTQSSRISYVSSAPAIARVDSVGRVAPVARGSAKIIITYGKVRTEVPVSVVGGR